MKRRVNIKGILASPIERRAMVIRSIIAIQAREGRDLTWTDAEIAYDSAVQKTS